MEQKRSDTDGVSRRQILKLLAGAGVGSVVFQRSLATQAAAASRVTTAMIAEAEWVADMELTESQRRETLSMIDAAIRNMRRNRSIEIDYATGPALHFHAAPGDDYSCLPPRREAHIAEPAPIKRPASDEELAFLPVTALAQLVRTRQVSSTELTELYLARLKKYNPSLHCVINLTEETARTQAAAADREIAAGKYRGPLHGIPWGAKDLVAWPGYPTTWGASPFTTQVIENTATVAARLEQAGAVLVAKLSMGTLAWGDRWFGGVTRNPWNPKEGSSGSSAGSASATAAGLVGFSLGSETLGSIISPSRRCGTSGLRPTFGRVSRHGCMSLAWSMDKIGPICRSAEDCGLVLAAIHGRDGLDPTAINRPFEWPCPKPLSEISVGYLETNEFVEDRPELETLRTLGVRLKPIELPKTSAWPLTLILNVEAACVFDDLLRSGEEEGLGRWPAALRQGQFIPAVEYLRANRIRSMLMREMVEVMHDIDLYVSLDSEDLALTNLTGHPCIAIPQGFNEEATPASEDPEPIRTPYSVMFTGKLFGESELLQVARAYQEKNGVHLEHPPMHRLSIEPPHR